MVCGRIPCASASVETIRGTRSSCKAKTSSARKGRSYVSAHRCAPELASMSCTETRRTEPACRKLPSTDIARGQYLANRPHVTRLAGVPSAGTAGDDPEIREARQASHDFFGQPLRQRCHVGVAAAVLEREHGDPEPSSAGAAPGASDRPTRTGVEDLSGSDVAAMFSPAFRKPSRYVSSRSG